MKKKRQLIKEIEIPEGVEAKIDGIIIKIENSKGEVEKEISNKEMNVEIKDKKIILSFLKSSKKQKRILSTFSTHIKNAIKGLTEGFTYKLKICSGHFPMNVAIKGNKLEIKNFLGEKIPREALILENVKVEIKGTEILVKGSDLEKVGQTASNIEQSTRITNRDRRVFQDGLYLVEKPSNK